MSMVGTTETPRCRGNSTQDLSPECDIGPDRASTIQNMGNFCVYIRLGEAGTLNFSAESFISLGGYVGSMDLRRSAIGRSKIYKHEYRGVGVISFQGRG